ncbi:MAG: carboxypeptidase regulatory-like domain-containing protein [Desulfomonile tiedjei]|nr:carboxypeptidase regulatory-like domain-containing protein [Desulfomonile tiedjei]
MPPNRWKPLEIKWPETYIEPTLKYGLNLVLPPTMQKGLHVGAGYNRWEGVPTLRADYFLPIKGWSDKSLFLAPRFDLEAKNERFSMGAGFRHLVTAETMVGFHAFHDWVRTRSSHDSFLQETGVGFELAALPGNYSDLNLTVNAYFPFNERITFTELGGTRVKEILPTGVDARLSFLLPPLVDWLDLRFDASVHSYRGEKTDLDGYKTGLTVSTRDGMLSATLEQESSSPRGDAVRVQGSLTLTFDWNDLLEGKMPFAPPYPALKTRYSRVIRECLYDRVQRKHDLPTDCSKSRMTLLARVSDQSVLFAGGFPDLPNAKVTVQVSQSPWRDRMDVQTDASGRYAGKLGLAPGTYKFRVIHQPTGRVSDVKTVVIESSSSDR